MNKTLQFRMKAGTKLFVNGAVMRFDRKVAVEFLNDVTFLLENHVLQQEDATTPLKQLYFIIQMGLIDPEHRGEQRALLEQTLTDIIATFENPFMLRALDGIRQLLARDRYFDALKSVRDLFPVEASIICAPVIGPVSETRQLETVGG